MRGGGGCLCSMVAGIPRAHRQSACQGQKVGSRQRTGGGGGGAETPLLPRRCFRASAARNHEPSLSLTCVPDAAPASATRRFLCLNANCQARKPASAPRPAPSLSPVISLAHPSGYGTKAAGRKQVGLSIGSSRCRSENLLRLPSSCDWLFLLLINVSLRVFSRSSPKIGSSGCQSEVSKRSFWRTHRTTTSIGLSCCQSEVSMRSFLPLTHTTAS